MNIKDIRLRKGLTQADVAAALGVSSVVYSRYETGKRQPSIDMLIQMADIFGVTVDFLLGRQDIEESTLSDYELQLMIDSPKAEERAKQIQKLKITKMEPQFAAPFFYLLLHAKNLFRTMETSFSSDDM